MNYEIEKRTLANGWVEVRLVTLRPMVTPDFKMTGTEARRQIAHLFLSGAAGICDMCSAPTLSAALGVLWDDVQARFQ